MENNEKLQEQVNNFADKITEVKNEVHKKIVGQDELIESLLIGLFSKGHILIE
jgi:MoxR-like ATPase